MYKTVNVEYETGSGIILNSHCAVKCSLQTNILFMASWSKTVTVLVYTLRNGTRPPNDKKIASNCHLEHLHFRFEVFFTA